MANANFEMTISNNGFFSETLKFIITPSSTEADKVVLIVESDCGQWEEDGDFLIAPQSFAANQGWRHDGYGGYWNGNRYHWDEEPTAYAVRYTLTPEEAKAKAKELSEAFYAFHKAQDETANLTLQQLRSFRAEDIVGEQGWEIVKTTSRRGRR